MADTAVRVAGKERERLMVRGALRLGPEPQRAVELRRGMTVRGQDGGALGEIAALVLCGTSSDVSHLVLGRLAPTLEYRLIPVAFVAAVRGEEVVLALDGNAVTTLPPREPSSAEPLTKRKEFLS